MKSASIDCAPDASAMVESLRAHGYTLDTAVADIVDNSIAAHARTIRIDARTTDGESPFISIADDGDGMSDEELVAAMRLGSRHPSDVRAEDDLGRFGLGLKTASFSQARRLTVCSRREGHEPATYRWDLDHLARPDVSGWKLLRGADDKSAARLAGMAESSGTVVLLEDLDRVVDKPAGGVQGAEQEKQFRDKVIRLRQHLAMVFHRYLTRPRATRVGIFVNDEPVDAWDPFVTANPATQKFFEGESPSSSGFSKVRVVGYVLPHRDRFNSRSVELSRKEFEKAAGPLGWNAQQGFYLYRNDRLIIAGGWLGLGPKPHGWRQEEHFKLARIQVDIPNNLDLEWRIDVKKSSAAVPGQLAAWLEGVANTIRKYAKDVYAHRGGSAVSGPKQNAAAPVSRPWKSTRTSAGPRYKVDRDHPLVAAIADQLPRSSKPALQQLLKLLEQTVPVEQIWVDVADNQGHGTPGYSEFADAAIEKDIEGFVEALQSSTGRTDRLGCLRDVKACNIFSKPGHVAMLGMMIDDAEEESR
ncbi:ATP-binding protein [bacterium]|nr:ATP-binding protein [bacterium]